MFEKIINWSEVWGLLFPLIIILIFRPVGRGTIFLKSYVFFAFLLNAIATIMVEFHFSMPEWLKNNNPLYNLHSICRVVFLGGYLVFVRKYKLRNFLLVLMLAYGVFVLLNFIFISSPLYINTQLFTAESILLILLSLSFFFRSMQDETETNWLKQPAFLVATGVLLYEAASFFIFLFFYPVFENNPAFGDFTLSIYNGIYVLFCVLLAIALYKNRARGKEKAVENLDHNLKLG